MFFSTQAFADVPIYCPKCKTHLYNYVKDELPKYIDGKQSLNVQDFIPAQEGISQPDDNDEAVCPFDKAPLNGYEFWAWERGFAPPKFISQVWTFMTKDADGNFVWSPYNLVIEDWEGKH